MALLLTLALVALVRGQEEASIAPHHSTALTSSSTILPAGSTVMEEDSRTTPAHAQTTSGLLKTDQGTDKTDESPSSFTSSLTANNVNSISIIDTRQIPTEKVELVTPFTEQSTSGSSGFTSGSLTNLQKDSLTYKSSTPSDITNEIVSRLETTVTASNIPSSTTMRLTTPPTPSISTTLRQILTTMNPLDSRSSVAAVEPTSTVSPIPSTVVRESGISGTVMPVVYPDAYAGNSGVDIESSDQGDRDVSTTLPAPSSTIQHVNQPQRSPLTTNSISRIDEVSPTTPRSHLVTAASNNVHVSAQPPNPKNKVTGTRKTGGIKIRKTKKKDNGMSALLYIPFMIQAQMIPMMLMNLKFMALKALTLGKLALLILGLNLLRNAMLGYNNDEEQYEHETLASQHYGYNGNPEYGSWINKRMYTIPQDSKGGKRYAQYKPNHIKPRITTSQRDIVLNDRGQKINKIQSTTYPPGISENDPYRAYSSKEIADDKYTVGY